MMRWSMESTFEEARAHLGIETQRQWSDLAIERTTPLLLCTYSLVTLIGTHLASSEQIAVEQTAWYRKSAATFHDILAAVRLHIWKQQSNPTAGSWGDVGLLSRSVLDRLLYAACFSLEMYKVELRGCIKRLNDGILFREPHSHEPYTVRRMSDTDLRESKKLFSHQKQEKEMLVLSQRSPFRHIE
jgi:hypothetical protein